MKGGDFMELLPKELEKLFPPLYATEGKDPKDIKIITKFFAPWSNWTWYAIEYDPHNKIRRNQALKDGLTTVKYPHDFLSRNRYMVSLSDSVIAVWDGVSRGTKYTFNYAQKQGKEVIVVIQKS